MSSLRSADKNSLGEINEKDGDDSDSDSNQPRRSKDRKDVAKPRRKASTAGLIDSAPAKASSSDPSS